MGLLNEFEMHHSRLVRQRFGDTCFVLSAWFEFKDKFYLLAL